ncbi:hypothetical protein GPECTOR_3g144 [Gonium pectorale]|uniref:EF-hand domain-containing protein n=1 Tax=Gonium pectorale TaxID=33097 RepID=A0A150GZ79_GONPE|nr:hypothetical protein GPECTOR_3g144 [Gonium pectorale]|eukprot:KXZ54978.1 hypothetical protein GPECTOR_3g144 [Gonium pectorale]
MGVRSTVSLIHAGRLVKVPQSERPADPAARETRIEDRPTLNRVHDKLFKTFREPFVHKVLRSYATDGSGLLTPDQLRAALERLHLGLGPEERERIVARVAPPEHGRVHYRELLRWLEVPQSLGGEEEALARGNSVPGPPTVRPGGGGHGVGDGGRGTYWNWRRHAEPVGAGGAVPGLPAEASDGSPEQARADELLASLIARKLAHSQRHKLRDVFRRLDADRNSVIDRDEFARGVASLGIPASRQQLDRLFNEVDTDGDGVIDYGEWAARFEDKGKRQPAQSTFKATTLHPAAAAAGPSTANSAGPELPSPYLHPAPGPDEVAGALRHPLVLELARSLYGKGAGALSVFQRCDTAGSGRLAGIEEQQLAALAVALEPYAPPGGATSPAAAAAAASGHVDYRSFVSGLLEGGLVHPRLLHSAPPGRSGGGGAAGLGGTLNLTRFGEATAAQGLQSAHTRSLSAVGLSYRAGGPDDVPPPPALSAVPQDRTAMYDLHEIAVGPFLESLDAASDAAAAAASAAASGADGGGGSSLLLPGVTRSVDNGTLGRSAPRLSRTDGAGRRSLSKAPSHATGRFSRFWDRRYADTEHVTVADPACAAAPPSGSVWVRKADTAAYLGFQEADREHRQRRSQQLVLRYTNRSDIDTRYSAQDDASGADDGRLAHKRALKQRYEERSEMYDRVRQSEADKEATCFFNRQPAHHEHQLEGQNVPHRLYW